MNLNHFGYVPVYENKQSAIWDNALEEVLFAPIVKRTGTWMETGEERLKSYYPELMKDLKKFPLDYFCNFPENEGVI